LTLDGWIDLETMTTELDGERFPVTKLLDAQGRETTDPERAVVYFAGAGNKWFSARIIRHEGFDA
jgi:LDH2 family malate/lactate/ureidoglycolate dehydrogenase